MDFQSQITYWIEGAREDLDTAEVLIQNEKFVQGLFWCHLAMEKTLKAIVVGSTSKTPPRVHNLIRLLEITGIVLNADQDEVIAKLMVFQQEGRYPGLYFEKPSQIETIELLSQTKQLYQWLTKKYCE